MRFFNTAGPCEPRRHYMVPAAARLPEAPALIEQGAYFVVHAPRQSGKTTTLRALAEQIQAEGRYTALHFSCKAGEAAGDRVGDSLTAVLEEIRLRARTVLPEAQQPPDPWPQSSAFSLLRSALAAWASRAPRPLVLIFDEIDALQGDSLKAVLDQLHTGYAERPAAAPWSVVLCGLRDVRDYKAAAGRDPARLGTASPFNIKLKSMRLGDFSAEEVGALYGQHQAETGQPFLPEAVARSFELSRGQPWLVNALGREVTAEMGIAPPAPLTAEHIEQARDRLIQARATHIDSLVARLHEPAVRRVIEPVLAGSQSLSSRYDDDLEYVRDLGLLSRTDPVEIANPIYREIIVRVLTASLQRDLQVAPRSFVLGDGRLDMHKLLTEFAAFFREHGEVLESEQAYQEVAPQLVLMAYLQRVVNGGGQVHREYGLGRGRIDLLLRWRYVGADGRPAVQTEAVELKVWRERRADPLVQGLKQLDGYLERLGLSHATLVIFDRRPSAVALCDRVQLEATRTEQGRDVLLLRA